MNFILHANLQTKILVIDLPLCSVLLEDNQHYPWLFLVPRRNDVSRIMDLEGQDQLQLLQELDWAQQILWQLFSPQQINVAAIGNKTPQLHVHVIARFANDPAWPGTVWEHPAKLPFSPQQSEYVLRKLREAFQALLAYAGN